METAHLKEDTVLHNGKYRIIKYIGSGGFGCTYEAVHTLMNSRVAIKEFFLKDFCERGEDSNTVSVISKTKAEMVERLNEKFLDEARALFQINHPNIVRVTDIFEENNTAYYVMEFIDGKTLHQIVKEQGPLEESVAVGYILQVVEALRYIHGKNRLHLDIKPANIMVDNNGKVVLIDFGASKHYDDETGEITSTLMGINTKGYAPIEQMNSSITSFSSATDIYALGATLYKLLTGQTPPSAAALMNEDEILEPLPDKISPQVKHAIKKAMEPKRSKRYQNVDDFGKALQGKEIHSKVDEDPSTSLDVREAEKTEITVTPNIPSSSSLKGGTAKVIENQHQHQSTSHTNSNKEKEKEKAKNNSQRQNVESYNWDGPDDKAEMQSALKSEYHKRKDGKSNSKKNYLIGIAAGTMCALVVAGCLVYFGGRRDNEGVNPNGENFKAIALVDSDSIRIKNGEIAQAVKPEPIIPKDFVLVPGGRLNDSERKGDNLINTTYNLDSFYIAKYELTQGEYKRLLGELKPHNYTFVVDINYANLDSNVPKKAFQGDSLPVLGNYEDFARYCNLLSQRDGYDGFYIIEGDDVKINPEGNGYRLPTSKEWTYAAKSGPKQDEYKFIGSNSLKEVAWSGANSNAQPHEVGKLKPNSIGLYDMSGNVAEMVESKAKSYWKEIYHPSYGCEFVYWTGYKNDRMFSPYGDGGGYNNGTRIVLVPPTIKNNNLSIKGISEI